MVKLKSMCVVPVFSDFGKLISQSGKISIEMLSLAAKSHHRRPIEAAG